MCTKVHPTNSSGPLEPELSVGSEITPLSAMGGGRVDSFQFHSNVLLWDHQWWHAEHTVLEIWLCSYGKDPHKCKEHSLVHWSRTTAETLSNPAQLLGCIFSLFSMPPTVATVNLPLNLYWLHISEQLCHCSLVYTITYSISTSEACQLFTTCAWSSRQVLNYTGLAPTPSPSPGVRCMHVG